mgnify:CR=1 FL=1
MKQTSIKMDSQDILGVGKFKVYCVAVESAGVLLRVENGGKKPRDYMLKDNGRGIRLAPDVVFTLQAITDKKLAVLDIGHADGVAPRFLKTKLGSLIVSRHKAEQIIIDKGRVVVTVMAFNDSRCTVLVSHGEVCKESFLILGDGPVTLSPKVTAEFYGLYRQDSAKLKFSAPKHISIDRHEVHMRKEFDIDTIESRRVRQSAKPLETKRALTA